MLWKSTGYCAGVVEFGVIRRVRSNLMNPRPNHHLSTNRRRFLGSVLATGIAPLIVPGHVLGLNGQTAPSDKITVGVIGVGAQGRSDLGAFLGHKQARVT